MLAVVHKYVLDINFLQFLIAVAIPMVIALITKSAASSRLKALAQVILTTLVVALQRVLAANGVVDLATFATTLLMTELIAVGMYYGLLKHTVNAKIAEKTASFGIGKAA